MHISERKTFLLFALTQDIAPLRAPSEKMVPLLLSPAHCGEGVFVGRHTYLVSERKVLVKLH